MPTAPQAPTVTVILPCYDLQDHIAAAIRSLQAQSFTDFETLVIDDGSTDGTAQVSRTAIGNDARFRLICTPHQGLSAARNTGLDAAQGSLIAFLDGDDTYEPDFLHAHVTELMQSGACWTVSALRLVWPDGRCLDHPGQHGTLSRQTTVGWIDLTDARAIAQLFPSVWNKLYRRDLIGQTRFVESALFEDHPFYWTLAAKARRIRYLPQPLYRYTRGRAGQITDITNEAMFQQLERLREVASIARNAQLHQVPDGLSQLATRVIHERLSLPAPDHLKEKFLSEAAQLMKLEGLRWDRAGALDIAPHTAPRLDPEMRLSVLVVVRDGHDPSSTITALQDQDMPVENVCCVPDTGQGMIATLLEHQHNCAGPWLACLRAGDLPMTGWASTCLETGNTQMADCVIARAQHSNGVQAHDSGFALPTTRLAAPDPAMLVLHKRALAHLPAALGTLPDPIAASGLAAHLHEKISATSSTLLRTTQRPALSLVRLAKALATAPDDLCPLTQNARASVFAHLAQMQMAQAPTRFKRVSIAVTAGFARHRASLPAPLATAHIAPYLHACLAWPSLQNKDGRSRK